MTEAAARPTLDDEPIPSGLRSRWLWILAAFTLAFPLGMLLLPFDLIDHNFVALGIFLTPMILAFFLLTFSPPKSKAVQERVSSNMILIWLLWPLGDYFVAALIGTGVFDPVTADFFPAHLMWAYWLFLLSQIAIGYVTSIAYLFQGKALAIGPLGNRYVAASWISQVVVFFAGSVLIRALLSLWSR